jgi:hypothetical protein
MSVARFLILVLASTGLAAASGDRAPTPGRVPIGLAARAEARAGDVRPAFEREFQICGWLGPPAESTTAARADEMKEAGLDLWLPAREDSGRREDNLARLELARVRGMRCILWDRRFQGIDPDSPAGGVRIDSIVADYKDHPAFFGYDLGDEPPRASFPLLARFYAALRARDHDHSVWNNLAGRTAFATRALQESHHRDFLAATGAPILCNDSYDFLRTGDRGRFVENAAVTAAIARENGIPFWSIVQLIEHGPYRVLHDGEVEWQVSMLLAYGAHGIGYFTWWTPRADDVNHWGVGVIDTAGRRTRWFATLRRFDRLVNAAGSTLATLVWSGTVHAGSVPEGATRFVPGGWVNAVQGRAALGYFVGRMGERYLLVANSDSSNTQRVGLEVASAGRACVLDPNAVTWSEAPCIELGASGHLDLDLEAGSFALVRLEGAPADSAAGGIAPALSLSPNPARGVVLLATTSGARGARLEIVDAGGRRVWSKTLGAGDAALTWRGEREGGGSAGPGLYFARIEDARGFRVRRLAWLGSR